MGLESATHLDDLDETWPTGLDPTNKGDDHIRMLKDVLKRVFPGSGANGFSTPITASEAELNKMDGVTASTAELNKTDGLTATTTELNYTDGVTSPIQAQIDSIDLSVKVNKSGDTMTGQLNGITPTADANFTRKDYVDDLISGVGGSANDRVLRAGDTMTGQLNGLTPVAAANFTRKDYVDGEIVSGITGKVDRTGDTMTGHLSGITPTSAAHLSRKDYVDGKLSLGGGTVTGHISGITPTSSAHLTRKDYVDSLQAFVTGTKMWFYQAAAPTGWSLTATTTDAVLGVNVDGDTNGTLGGAWTGSVEAVAISTAQMPAHSHSGSTAVAVGGHTHPQASNTIIAASGTYSPNQSDGGYTTGGTTQSAGGHGHSMSMVSNGSGSTHTHNTTNWRPKCHNGIICSKT